MRSINGAWLGVLMLAGCAGTDHSLGEGKAPAERNGVTAGEGGTPEEGAGGTPGSGGSSEPGDPGTGDAPGTGGTTGNGGTTAKGGTPAGGAPGSGAAPASDAGVVPPDRPIVPGVVPIIPQVTVECPNWANGNITFMGLPDILLAVGTKPPSASAPMVIYWHGTGSNSGEFNFMAAPVASGVTAMGGIIVSFQGTTGGDLYSGTSIFGVSDLEVVDQLVACAVKDRNVDPRRIYTMGCSAGGLFSTAMAALRSQYVAAAAPNSGGQVMPLMFESQHTPALMTVHGTMGADVVILDFAQASASADAAFKARGGFVIDCNTGGGHCGGGGLADDVWRFFLAHPFGVSPEPWGNELPNGFSDQCAIK